MRGSDIARQSKRVGASPGNWLSKLAETGEAVETLRQSNVTVFRDYAPF